MTRVKTNFFNATHSIEYDDKIDTGLVPNITANIKTNTTDKVKYNKTSAKYRRHWFRTRSYKVVVSDKKWEWRSGLCKCNNGRVKALKDEIKK